MAEINIRRTYKDSLFRVIFREKEELLSLYNAVNGSDYQNPEELQIRVLEDVLYMGMKNDISFLIKNYLNLYEAQSTWNPNMPLRNLFYLTDLYKGIVEENELDIYSSIRLFLPTPRCVVFYNGLKDMEDKMKLRLSDSFQLAEGQEPEVECVVTCLNINYGHNQELMAQCRKLYEYSYLVDQIRQQLALGKQLKAAAEFAVQNCMRNHVLESFLKRHRAEVTEMILREYNEERHIKNEKEISYQEGVEIGKREGEKEALRALVERKHAKGDSAEKIAEDLVMPLEEIGELIRHIEEKEET